MSDWRERLSQPQKPRTLPEMMLLALEMAVEDSDTVEVMGDSARREFAELAGFDLYERIAELLVVVVASDRDPKPPLITDELREMFEKGTHG